MFFFKPESQFLTEHFDEKTEDDYFLKTFETNIISVTARAKSNFICKLKLNQHSTI